MNTKPQKCNLTALLIRDSSIVKRSKKSSRTP